MKNSIKRLLPVKWQIRWEKMKDPDSINEVIIAWELLTGNDNEKLMIDVGAHYGNSLEPFVKTGWTVYAFEPDKVKLEKLNQIKRGYKKMHVEEIALGEKEEEEMSFFTSDVSSGISSLLNFHDSHVEAAKVEVKTLGNYCKVNNIDQISFLKSDTEGFDLPVLKGYNWNRKHPRVIVCEYDNSKTVKLGYDLNDQAGFLLDKGYKLVISEWHPIIEYGRKHKWWRFVDDPALANTEKSWGNIIAVKEKDWSSLLKITEKYGKMNAE